MLISDGIQSLINEANKFLEYPTETIVQEDAQKYAHWEPSDVRKFVEDLKGLILNVLKNTKQLDTTPYSLINQWTSTLVGINNQLKSLNKTQGVTSQHHNVIKQLEGLNSSFRQHGLYAINSPSTEIGSLKDALNKQLGEIQEYVDNSKKRSQIIADLVPKTVAGSLANAFGKRVKSLNLSMIGWIVGTVLLTIVAIQTSIGLLPDHDWVILGITVEDSNKEEKNDAKESIQSNNNENTTFWIKRSMVLLPIIYLLVFCFRQYGKDRTLRDLYMHKKTVGTVMNAYLDISNAPETKDQILLNGTSMIFNPPGEKREEKNVSLQEIKNVLDIKNKIES